MPFDDKIPRRHVPRVAAAWRAAFVGAMAEGLGDLPSGPLAEDQDLCVAAAALCDRAGMSGGYPAYWGGGHGSTAASRAAHHRWEPRCRWSAPRRAAVAAFLEGLRLGLSPEGAMRAVAAARHRVRREEGLGESRLGLATFLRMPRIDALVRVAELEHTVRGGRGEW